ERARPPRRRGRRAQSRRRPRAGAPGGVPRLRRPVASPQADARDCLPRPPSGTRRRLQRPREGGWRPRVSVLHARDGRLLGTARRARVSGRRGPEPPRGIPRPSRGGADQAVGPDPPARRLRQGRPLRRDLVVVGGLGVPAALRARAPLRLSRPPARRASRRRRFAASHRSGARRHRDDPAAPARASPAERRPRGAGGGAARARDAGEAFRLAPRRRGPAARGGRRLPSWIRAHALAWPARTRLRRPPRPDPRGSLRYWGPRNGPPTPPAFGAPRQSRGAPLTPGNAVARLNPPTFGAPGVSRGAPLKSS